MLCSSFQNAKQLYNAVVACYAGGLAWLVTDLGNDRPNGVGGDINMKVEALEPGLFKQCAQVKK